MRLVVVATQLALFLAVVSTATGAIEGEVNIEKNENQDKNEKAETYENYSVPQRHLRPPANNRGRGRGRGNGGPPGQALSASLGCADLPGLLGPCQEVDVAIVGGGFAGVGVAAGLVDNGPGSTQNIVVLEAQDYVGGRARTLQDFFEAGHPLEAGCSWTYPGTILDRLARRYGVNNVRSVFRLFQNFALYDAGGAVLGTDFDDLVKENFRKTFVPFLGRQADNDLDMQTIVDLYLASPELCNQFADCGVQSESHRQIINAMVQGVVGAEYNAPLSDLASPDPAFVLGRGVGRGAPTTRANNVDYTAVPNGGYDRIIQSIVQDYDLTSKIQAETVVTMVDQAALPGKVVLTTADGSAFVANAAAVTVSLGILKAGDITFVDPLSTQKLQAIQDVGFGTLNKIFLWWDDSKVVGESWYPDGQLDLMLLTNDDASSGEITYFLNEQWHTGNGDYHVLLGWTSGDTAEQLENEFATDDLFCDTMLMNLRIMLGAAVPIYDGCYVTRWKGEEYFKGSYSYPRVGKDTAAARAELARPEGRVYFAGEATMLVDYGTAYGAYLSGQEAAWSLQRSGLY